MWQQKTPSPNRVLPFTLRSFSGGINNRSELIADHECSDVRNMKFHNETLMVRRPGSDAYDATTLTGTITWVDEFRPYADTNQVIRATNSEIYANGTLIMEVSGKVMGANYNGMYFFVDGSYLYVYGKFPALVDAHTKIVGTASGTYQVLQVVNPASGYTPLGTSFISGSTKYDYTNNQVSYEPCTNEMTDTSAGANVLPSEPAYIVNHGGRLFVSGQKLDDDNVLISDLNNPFYYPVTLPLQLPPNSDKIMGMVEYGGLLIVGRQNDLYEISGVTNRVNSGFELFALNKLISVTGFASPNAMSIAQSAIYFLGSDGNVYSLSYVRVGGVRMLTTTIMTMKQDFYSKPINIDKSLITTACSFYHLNEWFLSIGDKVMVYSSLYQAWTIYTNLDMRSIGVIGNEMVWGNSKGQLVKFNADLTLDLGLPSKAYWKSKNFDMGDPVSYKFFKEFYVVANTFDNATSTIDVLFEIDYQETKDKYSIVNLVSVYGKARWGDRYISHNIITSQPFLLGRRGRYIRFTLSTGYDVFATVNTHSDISALTQFSMDSIVYVTDEDAFYIFNGGWNVIERDLLSTPMMVYQLSGDFEMRGKR